MCFESQIKYVFKGCYLKENKKKVGMKYYAKKKGKTTNLGVKRNIFNVPKKKIE